MKLVLVVEDEYGNAEILQLLLEGEGYRVALASNGQQALLKLAEEAPSVILSDFMMPAMNGGELGVAVREDATWSRIPFVFMSATSEEVVRRSFADYDAFITKPFDLATLVAVIERMASGGRPEKPSDAEVGESMRQLLKGIRLPGAD